MHINPKNIKKYIFDEEYRFMKNGLMGFYSTMPDDKYLRFMYKARTGSDLHLKHPKSFNEKIQWLKLNDRNPLYHDMVDKYEAKKYVSGIIGEEYIISTLNVWDNVEDIDFSSLPEQFVLKCTHDSHGIVICKDKASLDISKAKNKLKKGMKRDYYLPYREWVYKDLPHRIIAEEYISDNGATPVDYKVHNFNVEPKIILVCRGRYEDSGLTEDFYDCEWNHLDVKRPHIPNSSESIPKPEVLGELLDLSRKLSQGIPFVRTDFYINKGKLLFGEMTFYPASGFETFVPETFDRKLGDYLSLTEE